MSYRNEPGRHKRPADFFRLRLFTEAEMTERIERIRLEDAPALCPTCGSTTPEVIERKWCPGCQQELPVSAFSFRNAETGTRQAKCKPCKSKEDEPYRLAYQRRQMRRERAS